MNHIRRECCGSISFFSPLFYWFKFSLCSHLDLNCSRLNFIPESSFGIEQLFLCLFLFYSKHIGSLGNQCLVFVCLFVLTFLPIFLVIEQNLPHVSMCNTLKELWAVCSVRALNILQPWFPDISMFDVKLLAHQGSVLNTSVFSQWTH